MKVNSRQLYDSVNKLKGKANVEVYCDDVFTGTTIYWNGDMFEWEPGTFNSEAFFNPKYDFEIIEEKKIEKLKYYNLTKKIKKCDKELELTYTGVSDTFDETWNKINELIDEVNKLKENNEC